MGTFQVDRIGVYFYTDGEGETIKQFGKYFRGRADDLDISFRE